jgi:hypothetical protein
VNCDYSDIRDLIAKEPVWFDEAAVPRYCEFSPKQIADIYAQECVLLRIACQSCGHEFDVAMSSSLLERARGDDALATQIAQKTISYKDPPNVGCCMSGPSMMSEAVRVLEYWHRGADTNRDWKREASCEVSIDTRSDDADF